MLSSFSVASVPSRSASAERGAGQAELQAVLHADQVVGEPLERVLVRLLDIPRRALADVLHLGERPHIEVPALQGPGSRPRPARPAGRRVAPAVLLGGRRRIGFGLRSCSFGTVISILSMCRVAMSVGRAPQPDRSIEAGIAAQAREFKAEPSSFAVMSTIGMTRS